MRLFIIILLLIFTCFVHSQQLNLHEQGSIITSSAFSDVYKIYIDSVELENIDTTLSVQNFNNVRTLVDQIISGSGLNYTILGNDIFIYRGNKVNTDSLFIEKIDYQQSDYGEDIYANIFEKEDAVISIGRQVSDYNIPVSIKLILLESDSNKGISSASVKFNEYNDGFTSDRTGVIELNLKPNIYKGEIRCLGYNKLTINLNVKSSGTDTVYLTKEPIVIKEFTFSSKGKKVSEINTGLEKLEFKTFSKIPSLLGDKDVVKAIQMVPGVVNAGEGTTGFYVRGGNADQNQLYYNSIPVYNTSHLLGFFSAFNGDAIEKLELFKGHFPAEFGGKLSSFVDITAKNADLNAFKLKGAINPVSTNAVVEIPVIKNKMAIIGSYRTSYSDYLLKQIKSPMFSNSTADFYDMFLGLSYYLSDNTYLKGSYYKSKDWFNLARISKYEYGNNGFSISFHKKSSKSSLPFMCSLATSEYINSYINNSETQYKGGYSLRHTEFKVETGPFRMKDVISKIGFNTKFYNITRNDLEYFNSNSRQVVSLFDDKGLESALYIDNSFRILDNLKINLGGRLVNFSMLGPYTLRSYADNVPKSDLSTISEKFYENGDVFFQDWKGEFRLSSVYIINGKSSLKFSAGNASQYLSILSNTNAVTPEDQWKLSDPHFKPSTVMQYSLGYYKTFMKPQIEVTAEFYHKNISNILQYKDGANLIAAPFPETEVIQCSQTVSGAELMIKKATGSFNGWISYAYSLSEVQPEKLNQFESLNGGKPYPYDFSKPHVLNALINYDLGKRYSLTTNVNYSTGRPITYPEGIYYSNGVPVFEYEERNASRLPDYFRIDMALNIEGNLKKNKFMHHSWNIGVYNLTGRKNAYSVFFRSEDFSLNAYKLSIIGVPVFTVTWNIKLGSYEN